MNTNKILVTGLIGAVFSFFFGWLLFGIIFKDAMPNSVEGFMRAETDMVMWAMIVSNLLFGLFLAYIFVQWANISSWMGGMQAGAIIGLMMAGSYDFGFYAMSNMYTISSMMTDIALNTVYTAVVGAVMGWWLGRK